ncbi:GNAT family N-acetyltransferase [Polyangium sp. 15x6]|uniref:GNAT family N-acetyltransferase n=1 Tax=Polyangium sp. 15x6 TaxID=3042687 RepID=UPI00249BB7EA|nr:GNAT family N-acetyltransferase [Polyangium sp. 15x6]MDI3283724.1 GNAT family N-acetyltransferase [Polyangium sp. 15x6]
MAQPMADVTIRPLRIENQAERGLVLALFERSTSVGFPAWYTLEELAFRQRETAAALLERQALSETPLQTIPGEVVLIAETAAGEAIGFVWVRTAVDPFTQQPVGHVEDLATVPGHEGKGVGGALMAAAEDWARDRGLSALTLHVWPANTRARALYVRQGFGEEMIRMRKVL